MSQIKKFRRFAMYSFVLIFTTCITALLGEKKADNTRNSTSFTPTAHADVPTSGDFGDARDSGDTDMTDSIGDTLDSIDTDQPGSLDMKDANDLAQT